MPAFFCISNRSLLFLSFSMLIIYHSFGLQNQLCSDDDRSTLLQFKESFVFDSYWCDVSYSYTVLDTWQVGDDCCSWGGIECDVKTRRVIGIDISDNCLFASIDSSSPLFRLVHLTSLNLSSNNFNLSTIPDGIRSLLHLKRLDLSYSNFSGQIPLGILELSGLVSLNLSWNTLILQNPSLKDVVESFSHLVELHMIEVTISSPVPMSLSNLTSLSSLRLENSLLLGEFPSDIFRLPNLRILSLWSNQNLSGNVPKFDRVGSTLEELWLDNTNFSGQLHPSIANLESLRVFSASYCRFEGRIPSSMGNLTQLNLLELTQNYFIGAIPSSFCNLFQLATLSLSLNNFSSSTLHFLGKLSNLQTLKLRNVNLFGSIPSSFQNMTKLNKLILDVNKLTGGIPSWLGNSTQLTSLLLSYNELHGPIPGSIFRLPNIQSLELSFNVLSGTVEMDSFLESKYLVDLQLSFNNLSVVKSTYNNGTLPKFRVVGLGGCNLSEFPAFLFGQNKLKALMLFKNNITGYIPDWVFAFKRLELFDLAYNYLTGFEHPPSSVTLPWPRLNVLYLNFNKFEGPLPMPSPSISIYDASNNKFSGGISPLFCNLTNLIALVLEGNNLSGNLHPCLGNLGSLALVLNLRNNSLSGEIPDNFTTGCGFKVIDFSQNRMEGEMPRSLTNCSMLEILNLEENTMNDIFPSWLGVLPRLRILSLRSNEFRGAIGQPRDELEFSQLQIIDLSDNNFTGKLPSEYFRNWVAMRVVDSGRLAYMQANEKVVISSGYEWSYLYQYSIRIMIKGTERALDKILEFFVAVDLSSNKFEGQIPEIIGTLRELQSLNLSNNILTGHIPPSLANLTWLEALDLSVNELSGEIPVQLQLLTFLSFFNVSHNTLTGLIPQGNQFKTFQNDSFSANPLLCGHPLSKTCENKTETLPLPRSADDNEDDDSFFEFKWEIVLIGFGSGLAIGVAFGCAMDTRKYERLVKRKFARQ